MDALLHSHLPFTPWSDPGLTRLPGTQPVAPGGWPIRDECFAGQTALRDELVRDRRAQVIAALPQAADASLHLLDHLLRHLAADAGYGIGDAVTRPDGVTVPIDRADPWGTMARLVQDDLCLLQPGAQGEHLLTGAALLFPASWTLAEKIGRPLTGIHEPVAAYDAGIAARVQRMFNMIRAGQPIWRANWLVYERPDLFQPRTMADRRVKPAAGTGFMRSERQTLMRLPDSDAVVFAIHTYVLPVDRLTPSQRASLPLG